MLKNPVHKVSVFSLMISTYILWQHFFLYRPLENNVVPAGLVL